LFTSQTPTAPPPRQSIQPISQFFLVQHVQPNKTILNKTSDSFKFSFSPISRFFLLLQMPSLTYSRPKMDKSRGKGGRLCRVQGSKPGRGGLIRKYAINMNRQVFRERAISMGWKKYR
jgi:small subunit ribosomal protein S29e